MPYITTGLPNGGRTQFFTSNTTPLLRRLGDSISGNDAGTIGKEALLQAFGQVDNSGKRKVGQACHP